MMNQKAKELGCKNTNFKNPSGIHDDNHYSTAYDLSIITKYAMQFQTIKDIANTTKYNLPKTNKYNSEDKFSITQTCYYHIILQMITIMNMQQD